jgi:KDO2-lipid IV(A) lauroyltransferase
MRFFVEYTFVKSMLFLMRLLPKQAIFWLCQGLAALLFRIDARRRTITLRNLALAYPQKSEAARLALAKKVFDSFGKSVAEIILMLQKRIELDEMVEDYDMSVQKMHACFPDKNRGTLFLTAHFGNWELLAHFFAKHGYPTLIIGRRGNNQLIEDNITAPFRTLYGNTLAYKDQAMGAIIRTLKRKGIAGMLIDQKAGGANSVKSTFFGHSVDTVNSTALLKLRYDPNVIALFMARQPSGKFKLIVKSNTELSLLENLSEEEKIARLTQHYNDIIEEVVREYPEQWFWMHDRWRLPK